MGEAVPYAAERMPLFDAATAGRRAWLESAAVIDRLRSHLGRVALDPSIATIAVCGSLARMEYTAASDLDVLVILNDDAYHEGDAADRANESVWKSIAAESPRRPRSGGAFSRPISTKALADLNQLGAVTEQWDAFGKRINLLLASQPVYGAAHFERVLASVAEEYAIAGSQCGDSMKWSVLRHDVARHFHCVAANRCRKVFAQDPPDIASYVKFRFSVTLAHEAFLLLLADIASRPEPDVPQLLAALRMTPMERVGHVCSLHNDRGIESIASCYREFMDWSGERAGRELATGGDRPLASLMRRATQMRQELERLSLLQRFS